MAEAQIGLIGLAVMGANLALNIAEKGFSIAVHNRSPQKIHDLLPQADGLAGAMIGCESEEELIAALKPPRSIIILVKAGQPVDDVINQLLPLLSPQPFMTCRRCRGAPRGSPEAHTRNCGAVATSSSPPMLTPLA